MSTVERALKKLRAIRTAETADGSTPIARVHAEEPRLNGGPAAAAAPRTSSGKSIEFDLVALRDAGLFTADNHTLAEQYRVIKRPLLKRARASDETAVPRSNLIMVGSALAGEGKTFTCVNLSLSLATEKDWEVLLIDVDCKNPELSRLLGVADQPGVLELLRDNSLAPESLIMATNIERLSVLPLGAPDRQATELLASERMGRICMELSKNGPRRIAIFDSSPLLLTTEAAALSNQVGQVVVVVRANSTPQRAVLDAVGRLDPEKAIGIVLNGASEAAGKTGYGTYDSYGAS